MPMYQYKRKQIFEIVRDCAVNHPAAREAQFLRSAVDERTKFSDLGITTDYEILAICHEIERRIGYGAERRRVSSIKPSSTLGDAVSVFHIV